MKTLALLLSLVAFGRSEAQQLYFPAPQANSQWETSDPDALGWCTDQLPPLLDFLETTNTKAFIVLKDGKIVIEQYFGTFTADSNWYWASAGKTLTSFLVGRAQQEGLLDIDAPTSTYLGTGWTSLTPQQEEAITVWHQLTMTSGLDDGGNLGCTDPVCLTYLAEPGTRWSYHNAPYTLLDGVITGATGTTLNNFVFTRLTQSTGIQGVYLQVDDNNVFFSKARSMARFGLLMQGQGAWAGNPILSDLAYYNAMITPSQNLNNAYGYLWWLNGQSNYMLPGFQLVLNGPLLSSAPLDCYNALGKNGQILSVAPSRGLVVVRMGNLPTQGVAVPNAYANDIWELLNAVACTPTALDPAIQAPELRVHPNPATDRLHISLPLNTTTGDMYILDVVGKVLLSQPVRSGTASLDIRALAPGSYRCVLSTAAGRVVQGFVKE
jgi:CubicO group peptidase (beta-lactamase class C family)